MAARKFIREPELIGILRNASAAVRQLNPHVFQVVPVQPEPEPEQPARSPWCIICKRLLEAVASRL